MSGSPPLAKSDPDAKIFEAAVLMYFKFGCRNHKHIQYMSKNGSLSHIPIIVERNFLVWNCPVFAYHEDSLSSV